MISSSRFVKAYVTIHQDEKYNIYKNINKSRCESRTKNVAVNVSDKFNIVVLLLFVEIAYKANCNIEFLVFCHWYTFEYETIKLRIFIFQTFLFYFQCE